MKSYSMDGGLVTFNYDDNNFSTFSYHDEKLGRKYREGTYQFSQIRTAEIIKNNQTVTSGGHGVLGAILFGTPGAIVGSRVGRKTEEIVTSIVLRIHLKNADKAFVDINAYRKEGHFMYGKVMDESEQTCMTIYYMIMDYLENKG